MKHLIIYLTFSFIKQHNLSLNPLHKGGVTKDIHGCSLRPDQPTILALQAWGTLSQGLVFEHTSTSSVKMADQMRGNKGCYL